MRDIFGKREPAQRRASGMQLAPPTQTFMSQTWSPGQAPQSIIPKQPLPMTPQY